MEPISIAIGIITALAKSGLGGSMLSGLGSLIFGDKGKEVADKVISTANSVFGTTDPKAIELAVQQDKSKGELAIAKLEEDTKQYRIEVDDRKDARARDMKIRELELELAAKRNEEIPWWRQNARANIMIALAFTYLIGATAFIFLYIGELSNVGAVAVLTFLTTSMGNVLQMLGSAFNFEFGSSRGSAAKDATMAATATAAVNAAATKN